MLFKHKDQRQITLHNETEFSTCDKSPVLHICNQDGLSTKRMLPTLKNIIHPQTEWYLAYGPDAMLWTQCADLLQLGEIEKNVDSEYNFSSISYDEEEKLNLAIHKLTSLSSHLDNNRPYKNFNIITDSFSETKPCLEALGFTSES
jgi:hypothetical protein